MDYIAVLGYGSLCDDERLALNVGMDIAKKGYGLVVGNVTGTFHFALMGAKSVNGKTLAIVSEDMGISEHRYCDEIIIVDNTQTKHQAIADKCIEAIVIGGGSGTKKLISRLKELGKPVRGIKGTGRVAEEST